MNLTALITLQNSQQDPIEDVEEGEQEQEEAEAKLKKSPRKVAASKKPIAGNLLYIRSDAFIGSNPGEPHSYLATIHRTVKKDDAFVTAGGGGGRGRGRRQREPVQQPGAPAQAAHQEDGRAGQSRLTLEGLLACLVIMCVWNCLENLGLDCPTQVKAINEAKSVAGKIWFLQHV